MYCAYTIPYPSWLLNSSGVGIILLLPLARYTFTSMRPPSIAADGLLSLSSKAKTKDRSSKPIFLYMVPL